ncbi:MAG TPA: O-phosphoserine--tRNA ligase, partial [Methanobacterium sp.]|nr:O-phosphoserine--tRNA ligase [Methanobacterium sp.]
MDKKKIIKLAKKDFEGAWMMTSKTIKKPHHDDEYPRLKLEIGKSHMLYDTVAQLRQAYLNLGFKETVNPIFIEEEHIYKQFGPEAPAVLDRCFYIAGLPRPDIGIGMDKLEKIKQLGVSLNDEKIENLKEVFRGYKKGDVSGDDLVLEVSQALGIEGDMGLRILEKIFPEIRELTPVPSKTTLRSHMTSGWFITLNAINNKRKLPVKMFSIDRCFRREQREDSSHLMTYHSASCVVMDDEVSIDLGKAISESLLEYFGFEKFKFTPDEKKSKYYIEGTQTEVYGYHPKLNEWVEVATFGLYSPIALAKYGIEKDVLNIGVGVERIAMLLYNQTDVREMVYPETYGKWSLSDRDMASMLKINYYPATDEGKELMDNILTTFKENGDEPSPCEFTAFEGEFLGKKIVVKVEEPEKGTKLLGPAAWNKVYINQGDIIGVPIKNVEDEKALEALENGISTGISYMDGIIADAAYKIEEMIVSGADEVTVRVPISRSLSDINLKLDDVALSYITSK